MSNASKRYAGRRPLPTDRRFNVKACSSVWNALARRRDRTEPPPDARTERKTLRYGEMRPYCVVRPRRHACACAGWLLAVSLLQLSMATFGRATVPGDLRCDFRCDVFCWDTTTAWFDRRSGSGCGATTAAARLQDGCSRGARRRAVRGESRRSQGLARCLGWSSQSTPK